ncbi:hypothetical protein GRO01_05510 [Gluconobacter roseus NBRC 3990]|uniref:Uncharacterized protein n=1 Tax=Gluconobacter roseus NBRC 3990 TaxID=1307950 RepID=A0A4Y3M2W9_9PROT|nr:hypothetical protein GRO01_05510 [Gluconobacter roseus NBRC 3990]GLP93433.1 hypothetical protein GCM10007871_14110 [Gluconobacter roseus NBRC 3990]
MGIETHGLGINGNKGAEIEIVWQIAVMKMDGVLLAHSVVTKFF